MIISFCHSFIISDDDDDDDDNDDNDGDTGFYSFTVNTMPGS